MSALDPTPWTSDDPAAWLSDGPADDFEPPPPILAELECGLLDLFDPAHARAPGAEDLAFVRYGGLDTPAAKMCAHAVLTVRYAVDRLLLLGDPATDAFVPHVSSGEAITALAAVPRTTPAPDRHRWAWLLLALCSEIEGHISATERIAGQLLGTPLPRNRAGLALRLTQAARTARHSLENDYPNTRWRKDGPARGDAPQLLRDATTYRDYTAAHVASHIEARADITILDPDGALEAYRYCVAEGFIDRDWREWTGEDINGASVPPSVANAVLLALIDGGAIGHGHVGSKAMASELIGRLFLVELSPRRSETNKVNLPRRASDVYDQLYRRLDPVARNS